MDDFMKQKTYSNFVISVLDLRSKINWLGTQSEGQFISPLGVVMVEVDFYSDEWFVFVPMRVFGKVI